MIFAKPVTEISTADLQELLTDHAVENLRLEFKREIATRDETLKKLSAFANTIGGLVVIGAEAGGDGRITALPGLTPKSGYKQTVVQWCFEGASPPNMAWRSVGFPRSTGGGLVSQHESAIVLRPGSSFSILEVNTWGMLYYATEVEREGPKQSEKELDGIHSYHFPGQLLVFLEHAGRVLRQLGYVGPLTIEMKLDGIRGVPWIVFDGQIAYTGPASQLDDTATFSIEATTDDLTKARDAVAMNLMRYVFYATNLTDGVSAASLEAYVKGGYYYNGWSEPTTLRV